MTVQAWLIFTPGERDAAIALNDAPGSGGVAVIPRLIDNFMADQIGEGVLLGKLVAPARLLNDPEYTRWTEMCSVLPIRVMDSEVLFLPPPLEEE